ncbi:retrovirus-related pol polyprotein from transposon TNT 1-94 [Tanacetum coccineum]
MALEQVNLSPGPQSQKNVPHATKIVTTSNELDLLFSLMFDELLNGTTLVVSKSSTVHATDTSDQRQQQNITLSTSTTVAADTPPLNIQTTPETTSQALTQAPTEELYQFDRLDVWELVDKPLCKNVINMKWLWKNKREEENTVKSNKARLVAKGYGQKEEIDFEESFAPVEIPKKHGMTSCDSTGTPMATKPLDAYLSGTPFDQTKYRIMVGALMYLTASRSDIVHATCYCARYQARPTEKHIMEVKRMFRYLKNSIHIGIWYPKDTGFNLTAFSDSDHTGCLDRSKSTSGGIQFLGGDKIDS